MATTAPPPIDPDDPFAVHFHRDPLGNVGIAILVPLEGPTTPEAVMVLEASVSWLRAEERPVEWILKTIDRSSPDLGNAIREAVDETRQPILAIATSFDPPPRETWEALLKALDQADHVWMRGSTGFALGAGRWILRGLRRLILGVPLTDPHASLSLHRVEKLRAIPLQSGSSFVDVELAAKATFLGHVLDEVETAPLARPRWNRGSFRDARRVFKSPTFHRDATPAAEAESGPLEPPQGEPEGPDGPGQENRQGA